MNRFIITLAMFLCLGTLSVKAQNCNLSSAFGMLEEGRYRDCFDCLESIINENREFTDAYVLLAELYITNNMYDQALAACNDALKFSKKSKSSDKMISVIYYMRASCYYEFNEYELALADVNEAIRLDEDEVSYVLRINCMLESESKDYNMMMKDAKALLKMAGDNGDDIANAYGFFSRIALAQNDYDALLEYSKKIVENKDNSTIGYHGIGLAYYNKGIYDKAFENIIESCRKALDNNEMGGWFELLCNRIATIVDKLDYESCKSQLQDIAQEEGESWNLIIANVCNKLKKYEDVIAVYEKADEKLQSLLCRKILPDAYAGLSMFDKYAMIREKMISETILAEELAYLKTDRALAIEWDGRYEEAIDLLREISEEYPDNMYPYYRMGFILNNLKRYEEAVEQLEMAHYIDNTCVHTDITLGQVYLALGRKEESRAIFREVCEAPDSNDKRICEPFARLYLGETDKAIEAVNKLLDNYDRDNFETPDYYTAACVYSLMNEKEQALDYLEKALANGYMTFNHVNIDGALTNIRSEKRFAEIVEKYKTQNAERIAKLTNK